MKTLTLVFLSTLVVAQSAFAVPLVDELTARKIEGYLGERQVKRTCVDFTGTWKGRCSGPMRDELTLRIKQDKCSLIVFDNQPTFVGAVTTQAVAIPTGEGKPLTVAATGALDWNGEGTELIGGFTASLKALEKPGAFNLSFKERIAMKGTQLSLDLDIIGMNLGCVLDKQQ